MKPDLLYGPNLRGQCTTEKDSYLLTDYLLSTKKYEAHFSYGPCLRGLCTKEKDSYLLTGYLVSTSKYEACSFV